MSEPPLRVLVTVPWPERLGGAEVMLHSLLAHGAPHLLDATVAFLEPGPFMDEIAQLGVRTVPVPIGRLREPRRVGRAVRGLASLMRREQPEVVLNWVAKAQLYGGGAAALSGLSGRVVWWQHGIPDGHWMDRLATGLPARAIGCSSSAAADAQRGMAPRRPVHVVHPGIDLEPVRPADRAGLGVPPGRLLAGIVGRLQPWKGQHRFLQALAAVRDRGLDVHGLVVGGDAHGLSPEYAAGLEALIDRLDLRDRVTMTGHVADPRPYMAALDVMVSASEREPFGIVLAEAMAQGAPVVAVSDAGPAEIVEHGVSGLLVPAPDPGLIAGALEIVLGDAAGRARMAAAARERAVERFGVDTMVTGIHALLRSVARG